MIYVGVSLDENKFSGQFGLFFSVIWRLPHNFDDQVLHFMFVELIRVKWNEFHYEALDDDISIIVTQDSMESSFSDSWTLDSD